MENRSKRAAESLNSASKQTPDASAGKHSRIPFNGEKLFHACFAHAAIGFSITDLNGRHLEVNPAYCAITGYTEAELRALDFQAITHPEDLPTTLMRLRTLIEGRMPAVEMEKRYIRKNGEIVWVQNTNSLIRDEEGRPLNLVGLSQDVTERKRLHRALEKSESKFRLFMHNLPGYAWIKDARGCYVYMNSRLQNVLPDHTDDWVGKTDEHFWPAEIAAEYRRNDQLVLREGRELHVVENWEYEGEPHYLMVSKFPVFDEQGGAIMVGGTSVDITERKLAADALRESEERYRELFENSKDAIYVHNLSGQYISVNRAAEKLSGYPREEILGKHFWDFVAPEYVKQVRQYLCKKLEETGETTYEIEIIARDGRRVPVEVSSHFIYQNGVPVMVQGTARDTTERKRAQEALQTYSRRLIEAQEAERQIIARELHDEVGQVLTAVKISLHALQRSTDGPLPQIDDSLHIVDEAFGRVRELSLNLRPSLLDDLGLTAALRWYLDRYTQRTGVQTELVSDFDSSRLSRELETACFRIAQEALTNIVRHARATRAAVRLERSDRNLLLTVTDDGVGFEPSLFDGHGASALGLRGMTERARAVGGSIELESLPSRGTKVCARFPLKAQPYRS